MSGAVTHLYTSFFFWTGCRSTGWITLKLFRAYGVFLLQTSAKKMTGSGQVTEMLRHQRNNLPPIFSPKSCFQQPNLFLETCVLCITQVKMWPHLEFDHSLLLTKFKFEVDNVRLARTSPLNKAWCSFDVTSFIGMKGVALGDGFRCVKPTYSEMLIFLRFRPFYFENIGKLKQLVCTLFFFKSWLLGDIWEEFRTEGGGGGGWTNRTCPPPVQPGGNSRDAYCDVFSAFICLNSAYK